MCHNLRRAVINDGLETLGTDECLYHGKVYSGVFGDSAVESVELPKTLQVIECQAFRECKNLKEIAFGEDSSLRRIGSGCF